MPARPAPEPYDMTKEDDWFDGRYDQPPVGASVDLPAPAVKLDDDEQVEIPNPVNDIIEGQVAIQLPKVREWGISNIRTSVGPFIAATIVTWLIGKGINIDSTTVNTMVFAASSAIWYGFMRYVELASKNATVRLWAGRLLGVARAPIARVEPQQNTVER